MGLGVVEGSCQRLRTRYRPPSVRPLSHVTMPGMGETLVIPFSDKDKRDYAVFRETVDSFSKTRPTKKEPQKRDEDTPVKRQRVTLPSVYASTEQTKQEVEHALDTGKSFRKTQEMSLPQEIVEGAKAAFIASKGNIHEVSALYDLTPEAVIRLAAQQQWPVYGSTEVMQSKSETQLTTLRDRIWRRIEIMLESMDVEEKKKNDIVQYRTKSKYVEPLSARSQAFKTLMDQYMRISTILEPETFASDPDSANYHARKAREDKYPGGIEGVNREMADFLSEVVVGLADKVKQREMEGYGHIIDARAE